MKVQETDPVISEVREIRHRISERFGHDPRRLVAHYLQKQRERDLPGLAKLAEEDAVTGPPRDCNGPAVPVDEPQ